MENSRVALLLTVLVRVGTPSSFPRLAHTSLIVIRLHVGRLGKSTCANSECRRGNNFFCGRVSLNRGCRSSPCDLSYLVYRCFNLVVHLKNVDTICGAHLSGSVVIPSDLGNKQPVCLPQIVVVDLEKRCGRIHTPCRCRSF